MTALNARITARIANFNKILKTIELFAKMGQFACVENDLTEGQITTLLNLGYKVSFSTEHLNTKYYTIKW